MKSSITVLVQVCACLLLINMAQAGGLGLSKGPKRSRIANSGLMPFPRVGRSDSVSWEMDPNDYMHDDMKRSKFMQFPRVGRTSYNPYSSDEENDFSLEKRAGGVPSGGNKNSGLWFGPRLGRLHKRSDGRLGGDEVNGNIAAYAYLIELYPKQLHYAPRFAHEPSTVDEQIEEDQQQQRNIIAGGPSSLDMST